MKNKICRKCKVAIYPKAKICPHCGSKQGVNILIPFIIFFVLLLIFMPTGDDENKNGEEVQVIHFVDMKKDDINVWCEEKKVTCTFEQIYSDTVDNKKFVSQSIEADKKIYEGEEIVLTYSLGKEPSNEFKNALKKAEVYSETMFMSKGRLYDQLTSEYGE